MKILFTLVSSVFVVLFSAQNLMTAVNSGGAYTTLYYSKVNSTASGKVLDYSDIQGTPYLHANYQKSKIGNFADVIFARYNAYTDEVEIKLDEKIHTLPTEKNLSPIRFIESNEKMIYIDDDGQKGYYYILSDGNVKLLRKNVVKFIDEEPAQTSYKSVKPAKFQGLKPNYFLYQDSKLIPIRKESELIQLFPDKNLKSIIKDKKIKLNTEKDLITLAQLLS